MNYTRGLHRSRSGRWGQFLTALLAGICFCLLIGCHSTGNEGQQQTDTGFIPAVNGNYDSRDTAVVISKNTDESTITFKNMELGRYYTLNYDGATAYFDKYGQPMSLEQVRVGEIVSVDFLHRAKRLDSLRLSGDAFAFDWVEQFAMEPGGRDILLNNESYTIAQDVVVLTKDGIGDQMDINTADILRVSGFDHTIESIVIERGHGYLRLLNDSYFVGGFLEVGHFGIYQISEGMILPVPEGTYEVTVSNAGCSGTETISVTRNEEYEWDVSEWQGEMRYGTIAFSIEPANARLYIDGKFADASEQQQLSYGIHQMIVSAEGYRTISKYIKVSEEFAYMDIVMEWDSQETEVSGNSVSADQIISGNGISGNGISGNTASGNTVSGNGISGNTVSGNAISGNSTSDNGQGGTSSVSSNQTSSGTPVSTSGYQVTIEGPEGVEVYKDGIYIGLAPVSFPKEEGSYIIILRKDGCQTRSYTITVDDSEKDISYSFSALLPIS